MAPAESWPRGVHMFETLIVFLGIRWGEKNHWLLIWKNDEKQMDIQW